VFDILLRGVVLQTVTLSAVTGWCWLEIGLLLTALVLFATPEVIDRARGRVAAAALTAAGLVVHRTGVSLIGIRVPEFNPYVPSWQEVMITVGIVALGLLAFRLATTYLPVYDDFPDAAVRALGDLGKGHLAAPVPVLTVNSTETRP
jgi:Ni/Fe-hydrogenase subunit HybB-like protein